ncbi:hypothetical protein DIPPA_35900 [Diplonema papillatum]|nr:hypothetical protein DIPPA_35900 [Diplonema papillatum]
MKMRYEEMRAYAEKVTARLDEREKKKREYKELYKRATAQAEVVQAEREQMKRAFQGQLAAVKDQLVRLQGSGVKNRVAYVDAQKTEARSHPLKPGSPHRNRSVSGSANESGITVPQEFKLHGMRTRTGCWVCDSPDGPTKYGGALPHHRCSSTRREESLRTKSPSNPPAARTEVSQQLAY